MFLSSSLDMKHGKVKSLHINFNKINGYVENHNRSKHLTRVPIDDGKK